MHGILNQKWKQSFYVEDIECIYQSRTQKGLIPFFPLHMVLYVHRVVIDMETFIQILNNNNNNK